MARETNDAALNQFVGQHLKRHRERKRLTQSSLAHLLGVSVVLIQNAELGAESLPAYMLFEACQVFGISLRGFFRDYTEGLTEASCSEIPIDLSQQKNLGCA